MKRVLFIAYYFPPMGMGGVQRAAKFTKYLSDFGWEPLVVTVKDTAYYSHDPALADEVKQARIIRTESLDPLRLLWRIHHKKGKKSHAVKAETSLESAGFLSRLNTWLTPWLFVPDSKILWIPFALRAIRKICQTEHIDAVFTTSPPHSAHLIGLWLKIRYGLPWIADFRDDWMTELYERLPTPVHRAFNDWLARRALRTADRIMAVSPQITQSLAARLRGRQDAVLTFYNGFDASDFASISAAPQTKFTVTYSGTLNQTHDPESFFKGLHLFLDRYPDLSSNIQIWLVGSTYGVDLDDSIRRYQFGNIIHQIGYVSHAQSISYLMQSDLLLLIISPDLSAGIVTGKIFEYLASGRPILAVAPKSEAGHLIETHQAGRVVLPHDTEGIAEGLLYYYRMWKSGQSVLPELNPSRYKIYERREQTRTLAGMLDDVCGENGSRPLVIEH